MHGNAPVSSITNVPGWETPDEQTLLVQLAKQVPPDGLMVEIGSEFGMSASLLRYSSHPSVDLYCIDLFPNGGQEKLKDNLQEADLFENVHLLKGDSAAFARTWSHQVTVVPAIDLLFIDGDHSYQGCQRDIAGWTPFIKPGGMVAFHDTACVTNKLPHALHHMVSKAVNEWQDSLRFRWDLLASADTISVYQRPNHA